MRVTGHAPPRDGASSYQQHDFEQEAFVAVEKLAAEIEPISGEAPIPGGGRPTRGWKKHPGTPLGQNAPASFACTLGVGFGSLSLVP